MLTPEELYHLTEQFALLEPNRNGSIGLENIKVVGYLQKLEFLEVGFYEPLFLRPFFCLIRH